MKIAFYFAMELWGAIFCFLAMLWLFINHNPYRKVRNAMIDVVGCNAILSFFDAFAWLFRGRPGVVSLIVLKISNFMVFFATLFMLLAVVRYFEVCAELYSGDKPNTDKQKGSFTYVLRMIFRIDVIIGIVTIAIGAWSGMMYYFDEQNLYHRGPYFAILQVPGIIAMGLMAASVILGRKRLSERLRRFIAFSLIPPVSAVIIQMFIYGYSMLNIAITFSILMLFVEYTLTSSEKAKEDSDRLHQMQVKLMLSQVKPHFIYNVLNTIYYLCKKDPEKAQQAIVVFTRYLRGNLDSLGKDERITLKQEMINTTNYAQLEEMRFGERLHMEYDIKVDDFLVPALCVQSMVENAVKHGVCNKREGGTVRIASREVSDAYIIEVTDDGVGYHPEKKADDGRSHIGVTNTRGRVESMCRGTFDIHAGEDGTGTYVTIRIPKEAEGLEAKATA